jgi:hypothetical protein
VARAASQQSTRRELEKDAPRASKRIGRAPQVRSSATRPNNAADAEASQVPADGKSRKPLPHRNRAADFSNTTVHVGSSWRDSGGGAAGPFSGNKPFRRRILGMLRESGERLLTFRKVGPHRRNLLAMQRDAP